MGRDATFSGNEDHIAELFVTQKMVHSLQGATGMARVDEGLFVLIFHCCRFLYPSLNKLEIKRYSLSFVILSQTAESHAEAVASFEMFHHCLVVLQAQRQLMMLLPSCSLFELFLLVLRLLYRSIISNRSVVLLLICL